jgi:DnaJ-class molecular chaperone
MNDGENYDPENKCRTCRGLGVNKKTKRACWWCDGTGIEPENNEDDRQDEQ